MKKLMSAAMLSLLLLAGCSKDPVVADLEAFDKYVATSVLDPASQDVSQKMASATTNAQRIALLDDWIVAMEKNAAELAEFKAKTPEVAKISKGIADAIALSTDGAKGVRAALNAQNQMMMSDAAIKLTQGHSKMIEESNALTRLAAEKGYKLDH
jgi:PBP1b-binding outer membrane lipoprotein LpoB